MSWQASVYKPKHHEPKRTKNASWEHVRGRILRRDKFRCQRCGVFFGENGSILTAHHITPRVDGGADAMHNLTTLCMPCHNVVEDDPMELYNAAFENPFKREPPKCPANADWRKWVYGGQKREEVINQTIAENSKK